MRTFILLAMFTVALAGAETTDYEELHELRLDADGVDKLTIDTGSGSIDLSEVREDLIIVDDGRLTYSASGGLVDKEG